MNIASRIEEAAETGTVQVTEAEREIAGDHFDWKDLGLISIKGKKEQLHTFSPEGPGRKQLERWERAKQLSSVPFVGRSNELNELIQILKRQSEKASGYNRRNGAKHLFIGIRGVAGITVLYRGEHFHPGLARNFDVSDPLKWIARITSHIPKKGAKQIIYG